MTNPNHTDTSRSGDLVERLRSRVSNRELLLVDPPRPAPDHLCHEAADRIERLEAALLMIAIPRVGGGQWASEIARKVMGIGDDA